MKETLFDTSNYIVEKSMPQKISPKPIPDKRRLKRKHNILYKARRRKGLRITTRSRTIYYDINAPEDLQITQVKKLINEFQFVCQAEIREWKTHLPALKTL